MKPSYPILLYHHVSPDRTVTPQAFEAEMRFLLDQGYESWSLEELLNVLAGRKTPLKPGFAVTFDDGYVDNWVHAFPILEKLKIKATMYLVTSRVENHAALRPHHIPLDTLTDERGPGGFLSWTEVRAMHASGLVQFGSHTHTHRYFIRRSHYENLEMELNNSRDMIASHLNQPCLDLAWPWGDYENSWVSDLQKAGYRSAMTTQAGANTVGTSPFKLHRLGMRHGKLKRLKSYMLWNRYAWSASLIGTFYGMDRRLKQWWKDETPYSHG